MKKRLLSAITFFLLAAVLVTGLNDVVMRKQDNRYYILEKELEENNEVYEVQIYGSCHAYTSFNPMLLIEKHDVTCYNLANAGETFPATYLRMLNRFKKDSPKIAVVEIWGVNPYETYISVQDNLGSYLPYNIERLPLTMEKIEVINDFDTLDLLAENFALAKYKDRLLDYSITGADLNYSYELLKSTYDPEGDYWLYEEMDLRFENNGFKPYITGNVDGYEEMQAKIEYGEAMAVEPDIMKYVEKIIELCEEYEVKPIFYRAPYRSTANELRKVNYLKKYFAEKQIPFFDLEEEIPFEYATDFHDYEHLSETGAQKATEFLCEYIMEYLN